ncbi:hypothetical protein MMC29_003621 [Sticta canariensis]|nr:hypothetical protein [Sticta canariensis]
MAAVTRASRLQGRTRVGSNTRYFGHFHVTPSPIFAKQLAGKTLTATPRVASRRPASMRSRAAADSEKWDQLEGKQVIIVPHYWLLYLCQHTRRNLILVRAPGLAGLRAEASGHYFSVDECTSYLQFQNFQQRLSVWELATKLARDVLPRLEQEQHTKLLLVSIGPPERGIVLALCISLYRLDHLQQEHKLMHLWLEFSDLTSYPTDRLLADPDNVTYSALGFKKGFASTFLDPRTPLAIFDRFRKDGAKVLKEILPKTKLWIPPQKDQLSEHQAVRLVNMQGTQQGGALIFDGRECIWEHYDKATAAHADPKEVLDRLLQR